MNAQVKTRMLQLAVKLQQAMYELSVLMHEYPELCKGIDDDMVGGADYRIARLAGRLIDIAAS